MIPNVCLSLTNSRKLQICKCLKLEKKVDNGQDYALTTFMVQNFFSLFRVIPCVPWAYSLPLLFSATRTQSCGQSFFRTMQWAT